VSFLLIQLLVSFLVLEQKDVQVLIGVFLGQDRQQAVMLKTIFLFRAQQCFVTHLLSIPSTGPVTVTIDKAKLDNVLMKTEELEAAVWELRQFLSDLNID
jgi:hypothetical protein